MLRQRTLWLPTWKGTLLLFVLLAGVLYALAKGIYPFLAVKTPAATGVFVVEGWLTKSALAHAAEELRERKYSACYVTGGQIDPESPLESFGTYARYGEACLRELGVAEAVAIPSGKALRDRTYATAKDLFDHLKSHGGIPQQITLYTAPTHSRRSRLLFQKAFGSSATIGSLPCSQSSYDPKHWWRSSNGVRDVIGETLAYGYARFLFHPEP